MFLDGLLFHFRFHAQVADKGVDSVFVEPVEGISIDAGGEMLAESGPTFHCSGGPLVRDALLLAEFIKVFNDRRALSGYGNLLAIISKLLVSTCGIRVITCQQLFQLINRRADTTSVFEIQEDTLDSVEAFVDKS